MKIAKPILLISTPIGLAGGLYEAFKLAGGLAFIMVALIGVISAAMGMLVMTIRRERAAELAQAKLAQRELVERNDSASRIATLQTDAQEVP